MTSPRENPGPGCRLFIFTLVFTVTFTCAAEKPDARFQWSYDRFAAQCDFKWSDYINTVHDDLFTDHDYSGKWVRVTPAELKTCEDCNRTAEVAKVNAIRVARFAMSSESGDWSYSATYCFGPSGKLQGLDTVYNTFSSGGWSFVGIYSYSGGLKVLEERWQDPRSGKQIAEPEDSGELKAHRKDLAIYKNVSQLPFGKLIK